MDKVSIYRQYIQELLTERANLRNKNDQIESEIIFDTINEFNLNNS